MTFEKIAELLKLAEAMREENRQLRDENKKLWEVLLNVTNLKEKLMKKLGIVLSFVSLLSPLALATGTIQFATNYTIQNTDDYASPNNNFYAHQSISGATHGAWTTALRPESGDYQRDDVSGEIQTLTSVTYPGDSPLHVTVTFSHTSGGSTIASCGTHDLAFTNTFVQGCTPQIKLLGNATSGYSCIYNCN